MIRLFILTGIIALVLLSKVASASSTGFALRYRTKSSPPVVEQSAPVDEETWVDSDDYTNNYLNGYGCFPPAYSGPWIAAPWGMPTPFIAPQPITPPMIPPAMRLYHRRGMIIAVPDPTIHQYDFTPQTNYLTGGMVIFRPVISYAYINPYMFPYPYPYPCAPREH